MADSADRPGCLHHVHVKVSRGDPDPSLVCSCAAGLVHMHDCPVLMGLECKYFRASLERTWRWYQDAGLPDTQEFDFAFEDELIQMVRTWKG